MTFDLPPGPPPKSTTTPSATPKPASTVPTTPDDRGAAFKPVEGGNEMQSGEKLLVEAYAAIWIIAFVMILLSWRRQSRIESRIAGLEGSIEKARKGGGNQ